MKNEKFEALRLADALASSRRWHELTDDDCDAAAAELRRLHEVSISLRDYFAAKAMQAIISSDRYAGLIGVNNYEHRSAADAYKVADAMLQARKQVGKQA